jgi:hypothetical protein
MGEILTVALLRENTSCKIQSGNINNFHRGQKIALGRDSTNGARSKINVILTLKLIAFKPEVAFSLLFANPYKSGDICNSPLARK